MFGKLGTVCLYKCLIVIRGLNEDKIDPIHQKADISDFFLIS